MTLTNPLFLWLAKLAVQQSTRFVSNLAMKVAKLFWDSLVLWLGLSYKHSLLISRFPVVNRRVR